MATSKEANDSPEPKMECIIHCSDDKDKLVSLQGVDSWKTLLRAAQIRNHAPILEMVEDLPEGKIPILYYHRKCRSIFTMKKLLDGILEKEKQSASGSNEKKESKREARHVSATCRTYSEECIFCQKTDKYVKGQNKREKVVQCRELRADEKIRSVATKKMDSRILAIVSRDLVAAEGHYHRSCYRLYTKEDIPKNVSACDECDDVEAQYDAAVQSSFDELFQFIRVELFANPKVMSMTDLTSRLTASMESKGIIHVKNATKKHIRRKLEHEFGGALHIIPDDNGKLLLYPDNLSMRELVKENHNLKIKDKDAVARVAIHLRADIKEQDVPQSWPPDVKSEEECPTIPESLSVFLCYLLTGCHDVLHATQRVQRLVQSFGQDIVYAVTCGSVKPSKHIILPFSVKSLTGNVELINILNRLGHCVSYSQLEEIDTALCLQKLISTESDIALPTNIHPGLFTTLAWDNIDRLEETVSGMGTSHRVNGIAVQAKKSDQDAVQPKPAVSKTKQRSISAPPTMLPSYNAGQRVGPPQSKCADINTAANTQLARKKNLIWVLARLPQQEEQPISSWTGFNILTRDKLVVIPNNIGYLPTINAPATQMATVKEVLNQSLKIMQQLGLKKIVCVFDQALYAKAVEIGWKHSEFQNIIPRLGVFHTICTMLGILGKRFEDAGLRDLCIESGVVAEGSVAGVLDGRKYNRAVRLHKLLYEAFMRLAWNGFLAWLEDNHPTSRGYLEETQKSILTLREEVSEDALKEVLESSPCTRIMELFEVYCEFLRNGNGSLSAFWMSYLDMVEILLGLIRASREGDWILHLASIRAMIPWCFAYDRINYARYLPYYYAQMLQLPSTHPDVFKEFMEGCFSVQMGSTNTFGRIPVDQAIEETVNKDTQTAGGTKGFSLKPGAVTKYYLMAEYRSLFLRQLRDLIGQGSSKLSHQDLQASRIIRDEKDVKSLVDLMENNWLNPMAPNGIDLVSLSTGSIAPPDVTRDLLRASEIGEEAYQIFRQSRLEEDPTSLKFLDKMTKQGLKTFSNINTKRSHGKKGQDVVLKADRNLFSHMILVAESRNVNMKDVLSHPLGPLPWALANTDGTLRKTNKAALARELEKNVSPAEHIPTPSACIIDGMSLIQKMNGDNRTFAQVAKSALLSVLQEGEKSERLDVVFDVYHQTSIKDAERVNRGADSALQHKNLVGGHYVRQWRKFLCSSSNKNSLIKFLVAEWKHPQYRQLLHGKTLYMTCEETCYKLTKEKCEEVTELHSTHEEADTRLLLHALHASNAGSKSVIITAEDTDVMVLCLAFQKDITCPIYQKCGTQNRTRFVDITKLVGSIGYGMCDSLIGLHAFTGCDTVSAFAGQGKLKALKMLKKDTSYQDTFSLLGKSWNVTEDLFQKIEQFTCCMYTANKSTGKVNELRHQLFRAKRGAIESSQLPPCRDCLYMHVQRSNYQAAIWKSCLQTSPVVPSPTLHGWTINDGKLAIHWMRSAPAPEMVLELLSCKCVRSCKLPDCTCLSNGLSCTDMCRLQTCSNQKQVDDPQPKFELGESDEESDDLFE